MSELTERQLSYLGSWGRGLLATLAGAVLAFFAWVLVAVLFGFHNPTLSQGMGIVILGYIVFVPGAGRFREWSDEERLTLLLVYYGAPLLLLLAAGLLGLYGR